MCDTYQRACVHRAICTNEGINPESAMRHRNETLVLFDRFGCNNCPMIPSKFSIALFIYIPCSCPEDEGRDPTPEAEVRIMSTQKSGGEIFRRIFYGSPTGRGLVLPLILCGTSLGHSEPDEIG